MCRLSSADRFHTFPLCRAFARSTQLIIYVLLVWEMRRKACFLPSLTDCNLVLGAGVDEGTSLCNECGHKHHNGLSVSAMLSFPISL